MLSWNPPGERVVRPARVPDLGATATIGTIFVTGSTAQSTSSRMVMRCSMPQSLPEKFGGSQAGTSMENGNSWRPAGNGFATRST